MREKGIGVVGTARGRKGWPHRLLAGLNTENTIFNHFHWYVDEYGTLVAKWRDNAPVLLVSTIHSVGKTILKWRRRPKVTEDNYQHITKYWGPHRE